MLNYRLCPLILLQSASDWSILLILASHWSILCAPLLQSLLRLRRFNKVSISQIFKSQIIQISWFENVHLSFFKSVKHVLKVILFLCFILHQKIKKQNVILWSPDTILTCISNELELTKNINIYKRHDELIPDKTHIVISLLPGSCVQAVLSGCLLRHDMSRCHRAGPIFGLVTIVQCLVSLIVTSFLLLLSLPSRLRSPQKISKLSQSVVNRMCALQNGSIL